MVYLVTDLIDGPEPAPGAGRRARCRGRAPGSCSLQALGATSALHARRLHRRRQPRHDPDSQTSDVDRPPSERIVMSAAGIESVQDVLATMREQELRGQEASANELPYVAPEVLMGGAPDRAPTSSRSACWRTRW